MLALSSRVCRFAFLDSVSLSEGGRSLIVRVQLALLIDRKDRVLPFENALSHIVRLVVMWV